MHLPHSCQDNGAWHRIFVPTYLQYLASRNSDNDEEAVSVQQKVWDFVYGDKVPHIVTVQGPVCALVGSMLLPSSTILIMTLSRSINASVNGAADSLLLPYLLLINAFFDDNEYDSDECRQEFTKSALVSWAFLYHDVSTAKDGEVRIFFLK